MSAIEKASLNKSQNFWSYYSNSVSHLELWHCFFHQSLLCRIECWNDVWRVKWKGCRSDRDLFWGVILAYVWEEWDEESNRNVRLTGLRIWIWPCEYYARVTNRDVRSGNWPHQELQPSVISPVRRLTGIDIEHSSKARHLYACKCHITSVHKRNTKYKHNGKRIWRKRRR